MVGDGYVYKDYLHTFDIYGKVTVSIADSSILIQLDTSQEIPANTNISTNSIICMY